MLVVASVQRDTGRGAAILRSVDPSDKLVYVWSSFEPDGARRAWACFDQPDLKAPHRFTVSAPAAWTVTSNTAPDSVERPGRRRPGLVLPGHAAACRRTSSSSTPGPFHEIREQRGDHSLGLYCRQSLRRFLERDADRAAPADRAGARVLRRAVRLAVPAGALRPGVRAGPRRRHGELGLRHLGRLVPLPEPPDPRAAGVRRHGPAARDGAHVVRRPGDHALVGRPVAQRGVRVLGRHLGGGVRDGLHRRRRDHPRHPGAARLPGGHGAGHPSDPRRGGRRGRRLRQLRRDHLREGPGGPPAAGRLRRRGRASSRGCAPTSATTPTATRPSTT